jgi:hypothetical protein
MEITYLQSGTMISGRPRSSRSGTWLYPREADLARYLRGREAPSGLEQALQYSQRP